MKDKAYYGVIVAILFSMLLCSCGTPEVDVQESTTDTEAKEDTTVVEEGYVSAFEPMDFGGETIRFLTFKNSDVRASILDVQAEEMNGDILNDAVYNRNAIVMEKFNVQIVPEGEQHYLEAYAALQADILSGDGSYDVSLLPSGSNFNAGIDGMLLDLNTLDTFSLDMPWWNRKLQTDTEILGANYFYMSDMNLNTWMQSYVVYYNKKLAESYSIDDLYEIVRDGAWTIEKLQEITCSVYTDLNGNAEYDENDLYGLSACSICIDCFWVSSDISFVGKSETGDLILSIRDDFYDVYEQVATLLQQPEMLYTDRPKYTSHRDTYDRKAFTEDRALFFIEGLCIADSDLRDMESDFGILPMPKYSEKQEEYATYSHAGHNSSIGIPITVTEDRCTMVATVLEDMAFYAMKYVRPAYYEKVLSGQIIRDDDSVEMLEIITQNVAYDIGFLALQDDILNMFALRTEVSNARPAASYIAAKEKASTRKLESIMESVRSNIES